MADWGSMFEDTAEEEPNAAWVYFTRAGRLQNNGVYYGKCSAYAVTLNYVLGLGCLGIPYAFFQAGLSFSILMTFFAAFLSMLSTMWIVEVHMRAMLVETGRRQERSWSVHSQQQQPQEQQEQQQQQQQQTYSTTTAVLPSPTRSTTPSTPTTPTMQTSPSKRRFLKSPAQTSQLTELLTSPNFFASTQSPVIEVASLVKGVLGKTMEILYLICLSGLAITGLWAYSNVAANSLVQQVRWETCGEPNFLGPCGFEYMINCAVFGVIVVPLSLLDTTEQATIQSIFTVLRFVTLGAMAIGAVLGLFLFPLASAFPPLPRSSLSLPASTSAASAPPFATPSSVIANTTTAPYYGKNVHWGLQTSGMGLLISSMCFSMLFQHSVPGLMAAIDPTQRQSVKHVFGGALISSALLYIVLGVTMALYFGSAILPSSNLNFVNFNFGMGEPSSMVATLMSYVIVLFPVVGSISVYPLITITLSNNLHVSTAKCTGWGQDNRRARIFWRLVAGIPPILLSLLVRNLSTIIQFSGLFAVPIAYLFPALLQLYSNRGVEGLEKIPNEFSWHFNRYAVYPWAMVVIGLLCWGLVIVQLVQFLSLS